MAEDWNLKSVLKSWAISLTSLWNGSFLIKSSVDFWNLLISLKATVPGLYLWGFLTPPVDGADFLAALEASCFLGALPPVDFLAVCLVLAILFWYWRDCLCWRVLEEKRAEKDPPGSRQQAALIYGKLIAFSRSTTFSVFSFFWLLVYEHAQIFTTFCHASGYPF